MIAYPLWKIEPTKILTRNELSLVMTDLKRKGVRSINARLNLVVVRLSCCCGLRASEIGGLTLNDVRVAQDRPHLLVRDEVAKGGRGRRVPLWWDAGTLSDLTAWKAVRLQHGANCGDPFAGSVQRPSFGRPLSRQALRRRFVAACKALGPDRTSHLTVHHGRHTFISHALAGGKTLAEVRDAAGHTNVAVTSVYLHIAIDDDGTVGKLFSPG